MTSFCIASRQEAANDLQNEFFQFPFQLEDLNDDEQAKYLTCHWKRGMDEGHRNSEIDAARDHKMCAINGFARNLVKVLNCKLVDTNRKNIRSFIGIPLQCFMVAECFQSKINEFILSANITMECSDDFFADIIKPEFNLLELYRQFFKRKWEIVEKEKGDNSKSNKSNVCNFTVMKETSYEFFHKLAFDTIFSDESDIFVKLPWRGYSLPMLRCTEFSDSAQEAARTVGLTGKHKQNDENQFIHRTFAEFLVAILLRNVLLYKNKFCLLDYPEGQDFFLQKIFSGINKYYHLKGIRMFLNLMVADYSQFLKDGKLNLFSNRLGSLVVSKEKELAA